MNGTPVTLDQPGSGLDYSVATRLAYELGMQLLRWSVFTDSTYSDYIMLAPNGRPCHHSLLHYGHPHTSSRVMSRFQQSNLPANECLGPNDLPSLFAGATLAATMLALAPFGNLWYWSRMGCLLSIAAADSWLCYHGLDWYFASCLQSS
jgi:hypothetical protein